MTASSYPLLPRSRLHLVVTENPMEPEYYREPPSVRDSLENLPWGLEMPTFLAARARVRVQSLLWGCCSQLPTALPGPAPSSVMLIRPKWLSLEMPIHADACPYRWFPGEIRKQDGEPEETRKIMVGWCQEVSWKKGGSAPGEQNLVTRRIFVISEKLVGAWDMFRENSFILHKFFGALIMCQFPCIGCLL